MSQRTTIVEQVFAGRHPGSRARWLAAASVVAGTYALVLGALPMAARPSLEEWAAALAARIHGELDRQREITIEPPPPPPAPTTPPPARTGSAAVRRASARAPAPARTAAVIARAPEAVDFTATTFVTGTAATYAGGSSTSSGTNEHAVESRVVEPASAHTRGGHRRAVSLDEASWSCPWPRQAEAAGVNEAAVVLRVLVQADGSVQAVNVLADPGSGFGDAARTCAMRTPFRPALDDDGGPVAAWSPPIRVRFLR